MKTQMKFLLFLLFFTSSTLLATAQEEMPSVSGGWHLEKVIQLVKPNLTRDSMVGKKEQSRY